MVNSYWIIQSKNQGFTSKYRFIITESEEKDKLINRNQDNQSKYI